VARQAKLKDQIKSLTLLIIGISIIVYGFPRFSDLLVYDRQAILNGELWRLLTAPFVHFSPSQIFWDVLVFGAAGLAIETAGYRGFWIVCIFATIIPSLVFLIASPELECYGGLSGLAIGAVAYFCLCNVFKKKKNRVIWVFILACMGAKIVAETAMGFPLFVQTGSVTFRLLPSVHIIGYLGAFAAIIWTRPNLRSDADRLKIAPVA